MSNDYTKALGAYDKTNKSSMSDPREIEVRALIKAAERLQTLKDNWGSHTVDQLDEALSTNQQLWAIFTAEMQKENTGLDVAIRNNIANLGLFVFKRTLDIRADGNVDKFDVLININRNIAAGLQDSIRNSRDNALKAAQNNTPPPSQAVPQATPNPYAQTTPQQDGNNQQSSPLSDFDVEL